MGETRLMEMAHDVDNMADELENEIQARIQFCEDKHFMYDWEEQITDYLQEARKSAQQLVKKLMKAANYIAD